MLAGELALTAASLFTGAAIYINVAEQPARLELEIKPLLAEWKASYKRGLMMQSTLAIIATVFGGVAYFDERSWQWLAGAILIFANWPFTLLVMLPANKRMMGTPPESAGDETRRMIADWGRLHLVRSVFGTASVAMFVWAMR